MNFSQHSQVRAPVQIAGFCAILAVASVLLPSESVSADRAGKMADIPSVVIDYFYEAGCPDCFRVRDQILPVLRERYEGFHTLNKYDIGIKTNVITLVAYQEKLGIAENRPVCMVVDYQYVFNGFDAIKSGLLARVEECVTARMEPDWRSPEPIQVAFSIGESIADERVRRFTMSAVVTAGLLDGINPCAISTLVFFMSLLGVAKVRGRGLLAMGVSFCLASFITYTAIGFGLFRVLHLSSGFPWVRAAIEIAMVSALAVLAGLSFRDAYRFHRTRNPQSVTLQLSDNAKERIHGIMKQGLGMGNLLLGGLVTGGAVTVLESICTGQVYVPTLVLVIKSSPSASKAWSYLLLYNLMFIVPLAVVFLLTFFGLRTHTLLEWSKRNVVMSKILLGIFFLAMGVLIALL